MVQLASPGIVPRIAAGYFPIVHLSLVARSRVFRLHAAQLSRPVTHFAGLVLNVSMHVVAFPLIGEFFPCCVDSPPYLRSLDHAAF